jgi:hypothetical protein
VTSMACSMCLDLMPPSTFWTFMVQLPWPPRSSPACPNRPATPCTLCRHPEVTSYKSGGGGPMSTC